MSKQAFAVGFSLVLVLVALACGGGGGGVERLTPAGETPRPSPSPTPTAAPTATPAAALPVVVDPYELYVIGADGSGVTIVNTDPGSTEASWSPEGDRLAFVVRRGSAASELHIVTPPEKLGGVVVDVEGFALSPIWSADGERLAFIRQMDADRAVMVVRSDGSGLRELAQVKELVGWLPDDRLLAVQSSEPYQGALLEFDVVSGQSRQVSDLRVRSDFFGLPEISPDGARVAASSGTDDGDCDYPGPLGGVWIIEMASGQAQQVVGETCGISGVAWSPDGAEIAYTVVDLQSEVSGAYVVDLASGAVRRLTGPSQGNDVGVSWLADGSAVLVRRSSCVACGAGPPSLVLVPAAGGQERVLVDHRLSDISPDGDGVVFARDGLQFVSVDGGLRRTLIPADPDWDYVSLQWSPDNRRLAS